VKQRSLPGFGERLAKLRKSRGLTQIELGELVGVSNRVIAYYEHESSQPPGAMLVDLAASLKVSTDELLGVKPVEDTPDPKAARLRKRLLRVETLPRTDQRAVLKYIEALLARQT